MPRFARVGFFTAASLTALLIAVPALAQTVTPAHAQEAAARVDDIVVTASRVSRDGFQYVFAVSGEGKVLQRKVTLGARQGEQVQVLEGVDGDLPLVRAGAGFLNDGDLVRVTRAPAPVAAPASAAPAAAASAAAASAASQR